ncbi:amidohydrolase family protein [Herbidospora yilanensis]|uniref:amidohydrolase family protein n=1 Tax=Herbidospora yilanensis TaxID=354426 RepID=UPI0007827E53|nr:amidohydrolase family protein [Herbidospora yilanensis]
MAGELIDVHAHFVTGDYIAAATEAGHVTPDGMPRWPAWTPEDHLSLMDVNGIRKSFLSVSSPGTHFGDDLAARKLSRQVNEYAADLARRRPDRFGHFASLPLPDVEGALAEAGHALDELGSDGVALMSNAHGRYLGDPAYEPLWEELDRRRAVVFVHPTSPVNHEQVAMGRPRPMLEFIFDTTRTVSDLVFTGVLTRHPGIRWIFTHGGGALPLLSDRMELFRTAFFGGSPADPSVLDQVGRLWFDLAGTPFPRQAPALEKAFGTGQILYGSDYCFTPPPAVAAQVASVDATWRALTTANARRLWSHAT